MSQTPTVEIVLGRYTRKLYLPRSYTEFVAKVRELFLYELPGKFKVYYHDTEGDLISVTTQDDFDIASVEARGNDFRFLVCPTDQREGRNVRWLMARSFAVPEGARHSALEEFHRELNPRATVLQPSTVDKSSYIAEADDSSEDHPRIEHRRTADAILEVAGSDSELEDTKQSIGEAEDEDKEIACLSCGGSKLNKRGEACKKCGGTGRMSAALKKYIDRVVQRQVSQLVQAELKSRDENTAIVRNHSASTCCRRYILYKNIM